MGILSRIFSNPEDGSKIVDGAISTLDNAFFTKQERSDASQKVSDWYLKYLAATDGQSLSRRFIAITVVLLWALLIVLGVFSYILIVWLTPSNAEPTFAIPEFIFKVLQDVVMVPFSIIVGFYFLTHTVRAFAKPKKN